MLSILNSSIYAQLKISAGGGMKIHMAEGKSTNSFNGFFDVNKEQQIGQFFDEAYIYALGASYTFGLNDTSDRTAYIAGFEYSRGVSENRTLRFMPYYGEFLTIASYSPYVGIGFRPKLKARNLLLFVTAGISYKTYRGEYKPDHSTMDIEQTYDDATFARFGIGADYKLSRSLPLVFTVEFGMEFGKVTRNPIHTNVTYNELDKTYLARQIEIPDNCMLIKISAAYLIDL